MALEMEREIHQNRYKETDHNKEYSNNKVK